MSIKSAILEKMVGFAAIDPTRDKIGGSSLSSLTDKLGLEGAVLYCSANGFHPSHSRAMQFYESAEEIGIPVFFHICPRHFHRGCKGKDKKDHHGYAYHTAQALRQSLQLMSQVNLAHHPGENAEYDNAAGCHQASHVHRKENQ